MHDGSRTRGCGRWQQRDSWRLCVQAGISDSSSSSGSRRAAAAAPAVASAAAKRCLLHARRFLDSGGVFKLEFGPKAFIVVSDPVVVRHLLKVRQRRRDAWRCAFVCRHGLRACCLCQRTHGRGPHCALLPHAVTLCLCALALSLFCRCSRPDRHSSRRMRSTTTRACWQRSWSLSWARDSYQRVRPHSAPLVVVTRLMRQKCCGKGCITLWLCIRAALAAASPCRLVCVRPFTPCLLLLCRLAPPLPLLHHADLETWRVRRRAIVPAFHKAYYEAMVAMFARCTQVHLCDMLCDCVDVARCAQARSGRVCIRCVRTARAMHAVACHRIHLLHCLLAAAAMLLQVSVDKLAAAAAASPDGRCVAAGCSAL